MNYHRLAHLQDVHAKVGDKISRGAPLGTIGNVNGYYECAHVHYDIIDKEFKNWNSYVAGWNKNDIQKVYMDPTPYLSEGIPIDFHHYGLEYLKWFSEAGIYHTGADLNGAGACNADLGNPVRSPVSGTVVHVYDDNGRNQGWGNMAVVREDETLDKKANYSAFLVAWAEATKIHEGFFLPDASHPRGSLSYRNNNPGNFRWNESYTKKHLGASRKGDNGFAYFDTYDDGWNALLLHLLWASQNMLRRYKNKTLLGYYKVYAPTNDGNNPKNYATYVAKYLTQKGFSVDINTKISSFSVEEEADGLIEELEKSILKFGDFNLNTVAGQREAASALNNI